MLESGSLRTTNASLRDDRSFSLTTRFDDTYSDQERNTALSIAASGGHVEVISVLVELGGLSLKPIALDEDAYVTLESEHPYKDDSNDLLPLELPSQDEVMVVWFDPKTATETKSDYVTFWRGEDKKDHYGEEKYFGGANWPMIDMPLRIPANKCVVGFVSSESPSDSDDSLDTLRSLANKWGWRLMATTESEHASYLRDNMRPESVRAAVAAAAMNGHAETVSLLVDLGASIDTPDSTGKTPLHIAASKKGLVEVVKTLLKAQANLEMVDKDGCTALDLAKKQGNAKCAALLESAMLTAWETATESTPVMESYLRGVATEGDVAKVAALLERCKAINVETADKVNCCFHSSIYFISHP